MHFVAESLAQIGDGDCVDAEKGDHMRILKPRCAMLRSERRKR